MPTASPSWLDSTAPLAESVHRSGAGIPWVAGLVVLAIPVLGAVLLWTASRSKNQRTPAMWAAGADPKLITNTADRAVITSMGCMVVFISLAATCSMTTALTIVFPGPWAWLRFLPVGLLWGLIVFTIDRWIVSTVERRQGHRSVGGEAAMFVARLAMAAVVGLVISEPIVLALFRPEINNQLVSIHQSTEKTRQATITANYDATRANAQQNDKALTVAQSRQRTAQAAVNAGVKNVALTHQIYLCEFSDAGEQCHKLEQEGLTTGVAGNGPQTTQAYQAWQAAARQLNTDRGELTAATTAVQSATRAQLRTIGSINARQNAAIAAMRRTVEADRGLLIQEQALSQLTSRDTGLRLTRIFIWLALMIVDLMPLLLRTMTRWSRYARKEWADSDAEGREIDAGAERHARDLAAAAGAADRQESANVEDGAHALQVDLAARRRERERDDEAAAEIASYERALRVEQSKQRIRAAKGETSEDDASPAPADSPLSQVPTPPGSAAGRTGPSTRDRMLVGGRWQIVRQLSVSHSTPFAPYLARDSYGEYKDDVVVKILADPPGREDDAHLLRRAMAEMSMPTGLVHENLAEVLDNDIDDIHGCYIVTKYYPHTLAQWLADPKNRDKMTLGWAVDTLRQLFSGLAAAWDNQYVHLDVKPANIGLTSDGTVKLFDFGLMQNWTLREGGHGTTAGTAKYTPFFAPPEQMRRSKDWINRAADVYGAAATFYRIVSGRPPMWREAFQAGLLDRKTGHVVDDELAGVDLRDLIESYDPIALDRLLPDVLPPRLVQQVAQWLSRDPAARNPGKAATFSRRLMKVVDGLASEVMADSSDALLVGADATMEPAIAGLDAGWRRRHTRRSPLTTDDLPPVGDLPTDAPPPPPVNHAGTTTTIDVAGPDDTDDDPPGGQALSRWRP